MSRRQSHEVRSNRKSALIGTLIGWTMKLVAATLRLEVRDRCGVGKPELAVPPVIYILWHNRFFTVPAAWNKICRKHRRSVTLTSASHDGDMVARAMAVFGLGAVRGSSSRRAVAALVGLRQALRDGTDVCLTPDGPRGPRYQVQEGVISTAQLTGLLIVPVSYHLQWKFTVKSWDRFQIPVPFARVQVVMGRPLRVPLAADAAGREACRQQLETELRAITRD